MPPPTSTPLRLGLRAQFDALVARAAQQNAATRAAATSEPGQGSVDHTTSLLRRWVSQMSPQQLARRFTVQEIENLAGLVGKHGGPAGHHVIGQALRAIGFEPRRDWTVRGRNQRYWLWKGKA